MTACHRFCSILAGLLTALGIATFLPPGLAQDADLDRQVADLEKQIQNLNRKLEELRKKQAQAKIQPGLDAEWVGKLRWRCIGPATMGGRIVALAVVESDPKTYWVATASGGLVKTTNAGVTLEHQFDKEATVSIGDVCVAPSNANIVWVGTGENNPRNSVSYGDGVYKSLDGGKTWKNMGLKKTFQIGKILIHPKNPDVVYVGALGRLYGPNEERGLFKTSDGGKTWEKILFVDDRTGVIDMRMHPTQPDTLIVATWERRRDGHDSNPGTEPVKDGYDGYDPIQKWGPGSGLWKTSDGGKTWKRLAKGLPTCQMGRIGLDWYRKDPNVVFAIIDTEKIGMGPLPTESWLGIAGEDVQTGGARLVTVEADSPASEAGLREGDVVVAVAGQEVKLYTQIRRQIQFRRPGDRMTLTVLRGQEKKDLVVTLGRRPGAPPAAPYGVWVGVALEPAQQALQITRVMPGSPAEKAKLQPGDRLLTVEGKKLAGLNELEALTRDKKPGDRLNFVLERAKQKVNVTVTLEPRPAPGASATRPYAGDLGGQRENAQEDQGPEGTQFGGVYKSTDAGESWTRINSVNPRPMYFSQIRVDPSDERYLYVLGISLYRSRDGGKTFTPDGSKNIHADQHALWIDPNDGRHMIVGTDGGWYVTHDRMDNWDYLNHAALGQFYHVAVDDRKPYRVYGGLQDNGSWMGPSRTLSSRGPINEDWTMVSFGDGFVTRPCPEDPDLVYSESQDGNMMRRHLRTGQFRSLRPRPPQGQPPYRFNWNTPFIISPHNAKILYAGAQYVLRSIKQGENYRPISPDLTRTRRGSITALGESPHDPDVLWAGTDDGYLWLTRDGGKNWTNLTSKIGLPGPRWVASIEPSRYQASRCYVVFDAHRSDDDEPYVYVTEDFGQTWKSLRGNLPWGSTRVLREDTVKENLLYLGTEFACWASVDRGRSWTRINSNLPTVAIHEIAVHPKAGEIVVATHGRSLWILDVTLLRQLPLAGKTRPTLFQPGPAVRWRQQLASGASYGWGSRVFIGENPPAGLQIAYFLPSKSDKVTLKVTDGLGKVIRELKATGEAGLNVSSWDLTKAIVPASGPWQLVPAPVGLYQIVLEVGQEKLSQPLKVELDPHLPADFTSDSPPVRRNKRTTRWSD